MRFVKNMYLLQYKIINFTYLFILLELVFTILVQTLSGTLNTLVSYLAIILAFAYSLTILIKEKPTAFITVGLLFTVLADLFLVVLDPIKQLPAMFCFSITQLSYFFLMLKEQKKNQRITHIIIRSIVSFFGIFLTIIVLKTNIDLLAIVSIFYYINLITNIVYSFLRNKRSLLFSIGLILFACCDAIIGLSVMVETYLNINNAIINFIIHPGFNLAWVFYVPSQCLIALSTKEVQ